MWGSEVYNLVPLKFKVKYTLPRMIHAVVYDAQKREQIMMRELLIKVKKII